MPLNFTLGQGSCLISGLTRANSNKAVLVQVFFRFEIVIFNNNFVYCMMSSFCSMVWVAGWILPREIVKCTHVFYPVCFFFFYNGKSYIKICDEVYFMKVARLHTTAYLKWIRHLARSLRKTLTKVWKDKKIKESMKELYFKITANKLPK